MQKPEEQKSYLDVKAPRPSADENWLKKIGKNVIETYSLSLKRHIKRNRSVHHLNYKLYHLLTKPYTFINAYARIKKTRRVLDKHNEITTFFGKSGAFSLAHKFRKKTYIVLANNKQTQKTCRGKSNSTVGKIISTTLQENVIIQEAIRGILETIYEPEFKQFEEATNFYVTNYGSRPGKNVWDAAKTIQLKGKNKTKVIKGTLEYPDKLINHKLLLTLLAKRIKDKKFLNLIKKLLQSGILSKKQYHKLSITSFEPYILSEILLNIYLFEFDKFIWETITKVTPIKYISHKIKLQKKKNRYLKTQTKTNREKTK